MCIASGVPSTILGSVGRDFFFKLLIYHLILRTDFWLDVWKWLKMIENRAVGTNDNIHQETKWKNSILHIKTVKNSSLFIYFVGKMNKNFRVGSLNRVGLVTPIKHLFILGLISDLLYIICWQCINWITSQSFSFGYTKALCVNTITLCGTYLPGRPLIFNMSVSQTRPSCRRTRLLIYPMAAIAIQCELNVERNSCLALYIV